jgi:glucosamine 6-phosphate synthetase-like amidotransferase/phosphosugar isomerase protein
MVAKYAIEHWTRIPVEVELASEFRYRDPILDPAHPRHRRSASPARPWTP